MLAVAVVRVRENSQSDRAVMSDNNLRGSQARSEAWFAVEYTGT